MMTREEFAEWLPGFVRAALDRHGSAEWQALVGDVVDGYLRVAFVDNVSGEFLIMELGGEWLEFELSNGYHFLRFGDPDDPEYYFNLAVQAFEAFRRGEYVIKDGWWKPRKHMEFNDLPLGGQRIEREHPVNVDNWVNRRR